jgi:hypothetical protein
MPLPRAHWGRSRESATKRLNVNATAAHPLGRANVGNLEHVEVVGAAVGSRHRHVSVEREVRGPQECERSVLSRVSSCYYELKARIAAGELPIVKADIEGFESDLFATVTAWIAQTCAVVEPHDWLPPGAGTSPTLQNAMLHEDRELLISGGNLIW